MNWTLNHIAAMVRTVASTLKEKKISLARWCRAWYRHQPTTTSNNLLQPTSCTHYWLKTAALVIHNAAHPIRKTHLKQIPQRGAGPPLPPIDTDSNRRPQAHTVSDKTTDHPIATERLGHNYRLDTIHYTKDT